MAPSIPCRLHFLFARNAPVAVIFRRGPSKWVQVIKWNTATDTFEPGQWFHGRIYERRCDLTPSGHLMVYFAAKQNRRQQLSDYAATWTAVSKPPWLTALALWPKGDTWAGGGAFADDNTLLLNDWGDVPHPDHDPKGHLIVKVHHHQGGDSPLFDHRLQRDGWSKEEQGKWENYKADPPDVWVRDQPRGSRQLVRRVWGFFKGQAGAMKTDDETFAIRSSDRALEIPLADAEWVDWDHRGRLVLARAGQLVSVTLNAEGEATETVLADFNDAKPTPCVAPASACHW